jgi:regulator of RNase E activity RraA
MTATDDAIALLRAVETATLGHILSEGFMAPAVQLLHDAGQRICGRALTVATAGDDGSAIARAIAVARPGDILVIARDGDDRHACWGAVLTAAAQGAGIAGVVVDGLITDAGAIRASGLPVWCRGRSPLTTKPGRSGGSVNATIRCAGAVVRAGDLILADENGVCVLAPEDAPRLAREALRMQAAEPDMIARLAAGEPVKQVLGLP